MLNSVRQGLVVASTCLALNACGADTPPASADAAPLQNSHSVPNGHSEPEAAVSRLPVSLNAVMVAMVNQAADPIWVAAWRNPETEADWRELERRAVQLELAGALLGVPGTGPLDEAWAGSGDWQRWSADLREVGANALTAVQNRDLDALARVGDDLVEICEGCHIQFKPNLPTGGEYGERSPTAGDFDENPSGA